MIRFNLNSKILRKIIILIIITFWIANFCYASLLQDTGDLEGSVDKFNVEAGFNESASVATILQYAIQGFLSLLGIIFVILMLYAGYVWMMAHGEEEEVRKAKQTIRRALIGLVIVVCAYSITYFVFYYLNEAAA